MPFSQVWFISFPGNCIDDRLEHCLTASRGETHEKSFATKIRVFVIFTSPPPPPPSSSSPPICLLLTKYSRGIEQIVLKYFKKTYFMKITLFWFSFKFIEPINPTNPLVPRTLIGWKNGRGTLAIYWEYDTPLVLHPQFEVVTLRDSWVMLILFFMLIL